MIIGEYNSDGFSRFIGEQTVELQENHPTRLMEDSLYYHVFELQCIWMRQPLGEDENDLYSLMQHFAPYVMQPQLFISSSCRGDLEGDVGKWGTKIGQKS